jgi:hypothetical protein
MAKYNGGALPAGIASDESAGNVYLAAEGAV